jgi:hypothetical protein
MSIDLDPVGLRVVKRLGVFERAAVVDVVVTHVVKVEVVHEGVVLVEGAAALLAEAEVLCGRGLVDGEDGGLALVGKAALLGLPDDGDAAAGFGLDGVGHVEVEDRVLQRG